MMSPPDSPGINGLDLFIKPYREGIKEDQNFFLVIKCPPKLKLNVKSTKIKGKITIVVSVCSFIDQDICFYIVIHIIILVYIQIFCCLSIVFSNL